MEEQVRPLFELGRVTVTDSAHRAIEDAGQTAGDFISRHAAGDWGDVSAVTVENNRKALAEGLRLESVYHTAKAEKLLVITEADRSLTAIMRPEEF